MSTSLDMRTLLAFLAIVLTSVVTLASSQPSYRYVSGAEEPRMSYEESYSEDEPSLDLSLGIGNTYSASASYQQYDDQRGGLPQRGISRSVPRPSRGLDEDGYPKLVKPYNLDVLIPWQTTTPGNDVNGKPYAGWYCEPETTKDQKNRIFEYLLKQWRYTGEHNASTKVRKRMKERIGQREAQVLLEWEENEILAGAIAQATIPNNKNPDNAIMTMKGKEIFESLISRCRMRPLEASEEVREAFKIDYIWARSPQEIITHIMYKLQERAIRLGL